MSGMKITTGKPQLLLPDDAITRSFGILGMRGSGKSNAAVVIAEEMYKAGDQFVAIDPKGDWYGMRSSSDGKGPGLPVIVFGGEHQDVALQPTAAAGVEVADAILGERLTCILDLGEFTKGQKIEFLAGLGNREGFAERLFRKKKRDEHDPIHMFLEEAHDYLPQKATGEVGKLIEVVSKFQTMGRQRGFGCSVLSQRSARIHKDVLNQIDTLFAMRTVAPLDRKAILEWVAGHGVAKELVDSLPTLQDGEAWVWSPEWLETVERIRFRRRETYDSGATPVRGASRRRSVTLADIDLKALEQRMAAAIQKAREEDPKELQRRIRELEKQLKARPVEKAEPEIREVPVDVEVPIFRDGEVASLTKVVEQLSDVGSQLVAVGKDVQAAGTQVASALTTVQKAPPRPAPATRPSPSAPQRPRGTSQRASQRPRSEDPPADGEFRPSGPQQRILDRLGWLEAVGLAPARKVQVALLSGASPKSSAYTNNLGTLRTAGLINYPGAGLVGLTAAGQKLADAEGPSTVEDFHAQVFALIGGAKSRILEVLIEARGEPVSKEEVAERAGASVTSSAFTNNLGSLRSLGLIEYPSPGYVAALPVLFLEAVA